MTKEKLALKNEKKTSSHPQIGVKSKLKMGEEYFRCLFYQRRNIIREKHTEKERTESLNKNITTQIFFLQ